MTISSYEICATACVEKGLLAVARLLGEIEAGRSTVFLVSPCDRSDGYRAEHDHSRVFHMHRRKAEASALRRNVDALRRFRVHLPLNVAGHSYYTDLPLEEFQRRARLILGPYYWFPRGTGSPLFPASTTDTQLAACLELLRDRFHIVEEVPFLPPGAGLPPIGARTPTAPQESSEGAIPDSDELLIASDLCEEQSFPDQARVLRVLAGEQGQIPVVIDYDIVYGDPDLLWEPPAQGTARYATVDRDQAQDLADLHKGRRVRSQRITHFDPIEDLTSLSAPEFCDKVGRILGVPYHLSRNDGRGELTPLPESATENQMAEIARLLDKLQIVRVLEAEPA